MTIHELKIAPKYFFDVVTGIKTAEIRYNDRGYKAGDILILKEWDNGYTGNQTKVTVTHVLDKFEGLQPNFVVLSLKIETIGVNDLKQILKMTLEAYSFANDFNKTVTDMLVPHMALCQKLYRTDDDVKDMVNKISKYL